MAKPKVVTLNTTTGDEIVREMTDQEYAQYVKDQETNQLADD
jgi:hypothetical protein